jgi:hypothetical protein
VDLLDPTRRAAAVACLRSIIHPEIKPALAELTANIRCGVGGGRVAAVARGVLADGGGVLRVLRGLAEARPELQLLVDEVCCPAAPIDAPDPDNDPVL